MSAHKYGQLTTARQPGSELTYRSDGLIEGQLVYALDTASSLSAAKGMLGQAHPDDPTVTLYAGRLCRGRNGLAVFSFDCLGIAKDPTDRVVQGAPQVSTTAIQAHPKFVSTLAGTSANPLHGAIYDEDGRFLEFGALPDDDSGASLMGITSFYDGGISARATYYTRKAPSFTKAFTLTASIPNLPHYAGINKWLYFPPGFEQIPNTGLFKITEEYVSVAPGGEAAAALIYGP